MNPSFRTKFTGLLLTIIICVLYGALPWSAQEVGAARSAHTTFQMVDEQAVLNGQTGLSVNDQANLTEQSMNGQARHGEQTKQFHVEQMGFIQGEQTGLSRDGQARLNDNGPRLSIIPGGQTIGVKVKSSGILVVGFHQVMIEDGKKISPGENAQLQLGDLITAIDGHHLNDVSQVSHYVEQAGLDDRPLKLQVLRNDKTLTIELRPSYDMIDKAYRLGIYIRDSAAGVGTLTFYAPEHGVYGALGHMITDMDTHTPITVGGGEIVHSKVTSITKSQNGTPGEKKAHFTKDSKVIGSVERNTSFGIFGKMTEAPAFGKIGAIPVAFAHEAKVGKAHILTVINGQEVERFDIEVVHVSPQNEAATKGLVIRITDPKLLASTGGIVQGMSGSPIIQDGKLIGAVTHVFVNDPTSGYGCYIEWMLQDAGINLRSPHSNTFRTGIAS